MRQEMSRPARGAWIETVNLPQKENPAESRPARGAWIETIPASYKAQNLTVAPRTGRVD
ncbi:hypothetical protein HMPREF1147_2002 [Selenomonas sp. FOBRC9]|nr:hypothetical protein HMPREF1147_2002 [Selenomonas sp. FOBRC9]